MQQVMVIPGMKSDIIRAVSTGFIIRESWSIYWTILMLHEISWRMGLAIISLPYIVSKTALMYREEMIRIIDDSDEANTHFPVFNKKNQEYMKFLAPLYGCTDVYYQDPEI